MELAELAAFINANNAYATVVEAFSSLNIVIEEGIGATGTAIAVAGGPASTAIGTLGETALELAAQAQLQATGTGVSTAGIGLVQGAGGTSAAGLLAMDVGVVAGSLSPLLGISLGSNLYQDNPQFWTQLSQKLLPFCYPGTTKIPTWAEIINGVWQTSVPKKILDALRNFYEEKGMMGDPFKKESTGPQIQYYGQNYFTRSATKVQHIVSATRVIEQECLPENGLFGLLRQTNSYTWLFVSLSSTASFIKKVIDNGVITSETVLTANRSIGVSRTGETFYYSNTALRADESDSNISSYDVLADIIFNGYSAGAEYPVGTSQWTGNSPTTTSSNPSITGYNPTTGQATTQPMVPFAPTYPIIIIPEPIVEPEPETIPFPWPEPEYEPHTRPWPTIMPWPLPEEQPTWWPIEIPYPGKYPVPQPTIDPDISPDPDQLTDPDEQISPYIQPTPIPWIDILPEDEEIIDIYPIPIPDPSQPEPPGPPTTEDPPIDLDPPPDGITPWPIIPPTPLPFSSGGGLVTVYHPTAQQLYDFEMWLWVELSQASINTVWNNPFDGVITLFELYCTPTDVSTRTIHSGFLDSGISSNVISRYTEIDCGTIGIPEYYGNYFDYSPYSKAHVYLPFIGIQELNVDDIVGHCVNITYRIDEYSGACIAMITVAKVTTVNGETIEYSNTAYQFSGNCSVELPIAGGSQAQIKAGLMMADATRQAAQGMAGLNLVGGLASLLFGSVGGAIGGLTSGLGAMASGELSALGHMLSGKSSVQHSGSFGSSHGALGIKTPFIVITRPKQIQVPDYEKLYGFPAHKMVKIKDCTGFIRCREVHVISATANDEEKSLIEQLLKTGVYITE